MKINHLLHHIIYKKNYLSYYFFTNEPPKYKPIIADTKLVSNGVITKLLDDSVTHFIISFSGIKKNPGLNSK